MSNSIPCALQIGFAGPRDLWSGSNYTQPEADRLTRLIEKLVEVLKETPGRVDADTVHLTCGISQVAIGGDFAFTQACGTLEIPQRIFLPQPRNEYLSAKGASGKPDFDAAQQQEALRLLNLPHIIQEHVASNNSDRHERFSEVNVEIVRVCDVVIGVLRADQDPKQGGTLELVEMAKRRDRHVVVVNLRCVNGSLEFQVEWHKPVRARKPVLLASLKNLPVMPTRISVFDLPSIGEVIKAVKAEASELAKQHRSTFDSSAGTILVTHVTATILATLGVLWSGGEHGEGSPTCGCGMPLCLCGLSGLQLLMLAMLIVELVLLIAGIVTHFLLHGRKAAQRWSEARLAAEICRSADATTPACRCDLSHLLNLPLPREFRPFVRTLNILQLIAIRHGKHRPWEDARSTYVKVRCTDGQKGQINYYGGAITKESIQRFVAEGLFRLFTFIAVSAVLLELLYALFHWESLSPYHGLLGLLAITMPVLAVAMLSWSSSRDHAARIGSYKEVKQFLLDQVPRLQGANTFAEFKQLVRITEIRLIGETLRWYARTEHRDVA